MALNRYESMDNQWYEANNRINRFKQSMKQLKVPYKTNILPNSFAMSFPNSYKTMDEEERQRDGQQRLAVNLLCHLLKADCPSYGKKLPGVGEVLATGAHGTTVKLVKHGSPRQVFSLLSQGRNVVLGKNRAYASERYLVKVQVCYDKDADVSTIREDLIHRNIAENTITVRHEVVPGTSIVPEFIIGATLTAGEIVYRATLMGMVDAVPASGSKLSAEELVRVEKALLSLWCFGVSHSDLHFGNVLIDKHGRPTLIDLGFSVKVPEELRLHMVQAAEELPLTAEAWPLYNRYYLPYASLILDARGYGSSNPDTHQLRKMLSKFKGLALVRAKVYSE